jgi:3-methyladenine DNA glycosylase AlkD
MDQMERWAKDFASWDLCDRCIMSLFALVQGAKRNALEWTTRPEEYVKRAGFVIMARLASSNRRVPDSLFETSCYSWSVRPKTAAIASLGASTGH